MTIQTSELVQIRCKERVPEGIAETILEVRPLGNGSVQLVRTPDTLVWTFASLDKLRRFMGTKQGNYLFMDQVWSDNKASLEVSTTKVAYG